ncbi:hypothetical protein HDE_02276 [Halotydeus destructor]|nr:hypothetical protein HDE_02276 [Halotydeus destructor]
MEHFYAIVFDAEEHNDFLRSVISRTVRYKNRYHVDVIQAPGKNLVQMVSTREDIHELRKAYLEAQYGKEMPYVTFVDTQPPQSGYYCSNIPFRETRAGLECIRIAMPQHYLFWVICKFEYIKMKFGCELVVEAQPKKKFMTWLLFEREAASYIPLALQYFREELPMSVLMDDDVICTSCFQTDHEREVCLNCSYCGKSGHVKSNCNEAMIHILLRERSISEYLSFHEVEWDNHEHFIESLAYIKCPDGMAGQNFFEGFPCSHDGVYGLDCEMARVGNDKTHMKAIAVAVVHYSETNKLSTVFRALIFRTAVVDTVSWVSGLIVNELFYGITEENARFRLTELLRGKTVFVAGNQDMPSLDIDPQAHDIHVIDVLELHEKKPFKGPVLRPSLADLTFAYTGKLIQFYEGKVTHSCVEDAEHALLVGLKLCTNLMTYEEVIRAVDIPLMHERKLAHRQLNKLMSQKMAPREK